MELRRVVVAVLVVVALVSTCTTVQAGSPTVTALEVQSQSNAVSLDSTEMRNLTATLNNTLVDPMIFYSVTISADQDIELEELGVLYLAFINGSSVQQLLTRPINYTAVTVPPSPPPPPSNNGTNTTILAATATNSSSTTITGSYSTCSTIFTPLGASQNATVGNKVGEWQLSFIQTANISEGVTLNVTITIGSQQGPLSAQKTLYSATANALVSYFSISISPDYGSATVTINAVNPAGSLRSLSASLADCPTFGIDGNPSNASSSSVSQQVFNSTASSVSAKFTASKSGIWNFALESSEVGVSYEIQWSGSKPGWEWHPIRILFVTSVGILILLLTSFGVCIYLRGQRKKRAAYAQV